MRRFAALAGTVTRNAANYKTKRACELMIARLTAAWKRAGSYGCQWDLLDEAVWACRFRWQELHGVELDRRQGVA